MWLKDYLPGDAERLLSGKELDYLPGDADVNILDGLLVSRYESYPRYDVSFWQSVRGFIEM